MKFKEIAEKIIELQHKDLELRNQLIQNGQLGNGYHKEMEKLHHSNADVLNGIINAIGYPTIDKVGKEGSEAAWLVIQHSIGRPEFMKKCAKLLENAVHENRASPVNLAYLMDRIAVFQEKPQKFGTQFDWDEHGEMSPQYFDDIHKVNERRKSIGLNTLEEQTQIIREQTKKNQQTAPIDWAKRKMEIDRWKKLVGWKK